MYYSRQAKYKLLVDTTTLGRFKTATESGESIKADAFVRALGGNPRERNRKEVLMGSELFAS